MTKGTIDLERAEAFQQAYDALKEAASHLSEYREDPRVLVVLVHLEGMGQGWYHTSTDHDEYLVDLLIDLMLDARGTPVEDHWKGHPMTRDEAEAIVGKVEN